MFSRVLTNLKGQKNLFILSSLFTPVNNTKQYETLFSVNDVLKLDMNTGL